MKKNLLLCAALCAASAAWAEAPASVTISGEALAEEASVECTKVDDGKFEAFALLNGGKTLTATGGDLNLTVTPGTKGVYRITVDGNANTIGIKKIEYIAIRQNWTQNEFILSYAGNGSWSGTFNWGDLSASDNRYLIALHYVRDDQRAYMFAPENGTDATPDGSDSYFYMKDTGKVRNKRDDDPADIELGQWADRVWWKVSGDIQAGTKPYVCTVTMRGEHFTHSFAECEAAPATLGATGSALAEGSSFAFNKVNDFTYELFTKLKPGDLTISDGTNSYVIDGYKLKQEAGSTAISEEGVYCININFANKAASLKQVTSVKIFHLMSFGPIGESLEYKETGIWSSNVDIPAGDDRYRFEMVLDGEYQQWGPTISGLDSAPNDNPEYFNLKRVPWTYWNNKYKFDGAVKGQNSPVTLKFNAFPYVHNFAAYTVSGVESVEADENAPVEYYNLQGMRAENPANGLYIRRQGNHATKVLVK